MSRSRRSRNPCDETQFCVSPLRPFAVPQLCRSGILQKPPNSACCPDKRSPGVHAPAGRCAKRRSCRLQRPARKEWEWRRTCIAGTWTFLSWLKHLVRKSFSGGAASPPLVKRQNSPALPGGNRRSSCIPLRSVPLHSMRSPRLFPLLATPGKGQAENR
jgi:hypothetical protein